MKRRTRRYRQAEESGVEEKEEGSGGGMRSCHLSTHRRGEIRRRRSTQRLPPVAHIWTNGRDHPTLLHREWKQTGRYGERADRVREGVANARRSSERHSVQEGIRNLRRASCCPGYRVRRRATACYREKARNVLRAHPQAEIGRQEEMRDMACGAARKKKDTPRASAGAGVSML